MHALRLAALIVSLPTGPALAEMRPATRVEAGCEMMRTATTVRTAERAGEVLLDTGQVVRLAGLRIPDEDGAAEQALVWPRRFGGRVAALLDGGETDRW